MSDTPRSRAIARELEKSVVAAQVLAPRPRVEGEAVRITSERAREVAKHFWLEPTPLYSVHDVRLPLDAWEVSRLAEDLLDERAAVTRLTAEVERLREIAEEAINAARLAWHEGYDDAVDPAWSEKQLRYAKVDAEPHEIKAVTHFFGVSDTKAWVEELAARLAALSHRPPCLPTPGAATAPPEARK